MPFDTSTPGHILGIGGIFFKSADDKTLSTWYADALGLPTGPQGTTFHWCEPDSHTERMTVWSVFPSSTRYFEPGKAPFMINYRVDDLDSVLAVLRSEGVEVDSKVEESADGRFGWAMDPDGNRFELWEPPRQKKG